MLPRRAKVLVKTVKEMQHIMIYMTCRTHFDVPETINTSLWFYSGKKLGQFTNLKQISHAHKDSRKKPLHIYLYYPNKYGHLEFKKLLKYSRKSHTSHSQELDQSNVELDNSGYENSVNLELPDVQWLDNEQAQVNTKPFCSLWNALCLCQWH